MILLVVSGKRAVIVLCFFAQQSIFCGFYKKEKMLDYSWVKSQEEKTLHFNHVFFNF